MILNFVVENWEPGDREEKDVEAGVIVWYGALYASFRPWGPGYDISSWPPFRGLSVYRVVIMHWASNVKSGWMTLLS